MSNKSDAQKSKLREPLCEMTCAFIDAFWEVARERLKPANAGSTTDSRSFEHRVTVITALSAQSLEMASASDVSNLFKDWVQPAAISAKRKRVEESGIRALLLGEAPPKRHAQRSVGRPRGPKVETCARVWTIDCLCELCGLTLDEAIERWNTEHPNLAYLPSPTDLKAQSGKFLTERRRVRIFLTETSQGPRPFNDAVLGRPPKSGRKFVPPLPGIG